MTGAQTTAAAAAVSAWQDAPAAGGPPAEAQDISGIWIKVCWLLPLLAACRTGFGLATRCFLRCECCKQPHQQNPPLVCTRMRVQDRERSDGPDIICEVLELGQLFRMVML